MTNYTLPPQTHIGTVALAVANLERSLSFYQHNIGLKLHRQEEDTAWLGVGGPDLLELQELPGATAVPRATGLYHFALLTPSRLELAKILKHLIETETRLGGFSDHHVSEAIYLSDPDGNGIEIYRDRPREEWEVKDGVLQIVTAPLDIDGILAELSGAETWDGLHPDTVMGHIHLQAAHLRPTEAFYTNVLGFDFIARYGTVASFVSAGGYHHHIGMNTWAGVGAPPRPENAVGLRWYTIQLPTQTALEEVAARVRESGTAVTQNDAAYFLQDPSRITIRLAAA
ncbi:MAG: VOC family protein [Chloroflexi bacterium]|nr:VOC family protein [Chloroflexota bacterium]